MSRGEEKPDNSLYKVSHRGPDKGGRGRGGVLPTGDLPVRGTQEDRKCPGSGPGSCVCDPSGALEWGSGS